MPHRLYEDLQDSNWEHGFRVLRRGRRRAVRIQYGLCAVFGGKLKANDKEHAWTAALCSGLMDFEYDVRGHADNHRIS